MVDPISTTAAAIEFLKAARACLYFYQEARQNTPQAQQELRLRLEVEAVTFERWCSVLGIQDMLEAPSKDPKGWEDGQKFKDFLKTLQENMRFENELLADLIVNVLKGLVAKFEDARGRFQTSKLPATASPASTAQPGAAKRSTPRWRGLLQSSDRKRRPIELKILDIDIGTSFVNLLGAVKWLTWNKRAFLQLLDDVTSINKSLLRLLGTELQTQIIRRVHIQILGNNSLGNLDIAESLPATSDAKKELGALASVKRMKIRENEADDGTSASESHNGSKPGEGVRSNPRLPVFQFDDFARGTLKHGPLRAQSVLGDDQVLVEWKYYSPNHPLRFEQILRLGGLVSMLHKNHVYQRFHIPYCKGLVQDQDNFRIGIVFDLPMPSGTNQPIEHSDLQSLIRNSRPKPLPLGQRFCVARDLAKALYYLHSVNWLHKSFRSDNIIYFQAQNSKQHRTEIGEGSGSANHQPSDEAVIEESVNGAAKITDQKTTDVPSTFAGKLHSPRPPLAPFYVFGLDLSRPDHPSELSETISISTVGYQSKKENMELYSHPESLKTVPSGKRVRFRAEFDIYCLGLVLLEIGSWRTLDSFRRQAERDKVDFRTELRTAYCDELETGMGVIYWRAVQRCLNYDFDLDDALEGVEEGAKLQFAFEKQAVCELEKCVA